METRNVPRSTIRRTVGWVIMKPCSMQSIPASSAAFTASSPWRWAAAIRPRRWASSATAVSSSVEYCCAPAGPNDATHPTRGAALDDLGTVLDLVADRPPDLVDAVGDALLDGEGHEVRRHPALGAGVEVAPVGQIAWPAGTMRRPSTQPASTASPRATSRR